MQKKRGGSKRIEGEEAEITIVWKLQSMELDLTVQSSVFDFIFFLSVLNRDNRFSTVIHGCWGRGERMMEEFRKSMKMELG